MFIFNVFPKPETSSALCLFWLRIPVVAVVHLGMLIAVHYHLVLRMPVKQLPYNMGLGGHF